MLGLLFYSVSLYACFITVALGYNLRSEIVIFLVLLYLLILVLAIKGLLCLQMNFSILFLVFLDMTQNFDWDYSASVGHFWYHSYFHHAKSPKLGS